MLKQCQVLSKTERKVQSFPLYLPCIPSAPIYSKPFPFSTSPTRVVHLLQWMYILCHSIITQYPVNIGFSLKYSVVLDKCKMTFIYYYGIIQDIFNAPKIFYAQLIHSFSFYSWQLLSFTVSILFPFPECSLVGPGLQPMGLQRVGHDWMTKHIQ